MKINDIGTFPPWCRTLALGKDLRMAALGRIGGRKGGKARAMNLTKAELSTIGKAGATARWGKPT